MQVTYESKIRELHSITLELCELKKDFSNQKLAVKKTSKKIEQAIVLIKLAEFSLLNIQESLKILRFLKRSSSIFAAVGGFVLALNIAQSRWGFLLLFLSSSQLLIASIKEGDREMIVYSSSLFIFVDSVGVYRWILS